MKEQIEEMAKDLRNAEHWYYDEISLTAELDERKTAKNLYDTGYRKQSEGEWIDTGDFELDNIYSGWKCSLCGHIFCGNKTNYCSNCGAKMKGGAK